MLLICLLLIGLLADAMPTVQKLDDKRKAFEHSQQEVVQRTNIEADLFQKGAVKERMSRLIMR